MGSAVGLGMPSCHSVRARNYRQQEENDSLNAAATPQASHSLETHILCLLEERQSVVK